MNLSEFKAWFEGFTEDMDGPPNSKQWKRIKKRVSEITSEPTPYPIFVDRYVRPYPQWWTTWGTITGSPTYPSVTLMNTGTADNGPQVTSNQCFAALGKAEANHVSSQTQ